MSQAQLAELVGVTYQQTYKYEKGVNRVAGARLNAIAKALGVEVAYFLSAPKSLHRPLPPQDGHAR